MAIANPRIHMICGICGSNKDFVYSIVSDIDDDDKPKNYVHISCKNCSSLTALDEIIKEKK